MRKIAHNPNVDVQLRLEAAKAVAPYLLPRLSTISSSVDDVFEVRGPNPIYIIPSSCFLTEEQMRNPDALIENAVPFVLDEIPEENIPRPRSRRRRPSIEASAQSHRDRDQESRRRCVKDLGQRISDSDDAVIDVLADYLLDNFDDEINELIDYLLSLVEPTHH